MKTRICRKAGCGRTCQVGHDYCGLHYISEKEARQIFTYRGKSSEYHSLYESARWRAMRKDFLKRYPVCFICGKPATIVDHITPHRGDLSLFYDENNLQPMCQSCHSRKTMKENNNFHKPPPGVRKN